MSGRA
jgi:hypothetical protein